jgi:hypothetical protein
LSGVEKVASVESLGNLREMCSRIEGGAMRSLAEMRERI